MSSAAASPGKRLAKKRKSGSRKSRCKLSKAKDSRACTIAKPIRVPPRCTDCHYDVAIRPRVNPAWKTAFPVAGNIFSREAGGIFIRRGSLRPGNVRTEEHKSEI